MGKISDTLKKIGDKVLGSLGINKKPKEKKKKKPKKKPFPGNVKVGIDAIKKRQKKQDAQLKQL